MRYSLLVVFSLILSSNIYAQDKYEPYLLKAGAYLNANMHSADFTRFPAFDNDNARFTSGFGLGPAFSLGGEYLFKRSLLGMPFRYSFNLVYSDNSADLSERAQTGFVINGNEFDEATADFNLNSALSYLMLENDLVFYPFNEKFSASIGLTAGLGLNASYTQSEDLVAPAGYVYENGVTTRNTSEGDIPEASSVYFGASLGVGYEIFKTKSISIVPELKFTYALTDVSSSVDWNAHSLRAGVSLKYQPAKPSLAPPPPPPIAELPLPAAPPDNKLLVDIDATNEGKELQDWESVILPVKETSYISYYSLPPVIFFKLNSTEPVNPSLDIPQGIFKNPDVNTASIFNFMLEPDNVTAKLYYLSSEDKSVVNSRIDFIKRSSGKSDLPLELVEVNPKALKYPELHEENSRVEFFINGKKQPVPVYYTMDKKIEYPPISIKVKPEIDAMAGVSNYYGEVYFNSSKIMTFQEDIMDLELPKDAPEGIPYFDKDTITIYVNVLDNEYKRAEARKNIIVQYETERKEVFNRLQNDSAETYYILGYFDFDSAKLSSVDERVADIVRMALKEGKKVEFIGHADNLGTNEYNSSLALKRAETAKKYINYPGISTGARPEPLFDNSTPYGRFSNRTVVVKINN